MLRRSLSAKKRRYRWLLAPFGDDDALSMARRSLSAIKRLYRWLVALFRR